MTERQQSVEDLSFHLWFFSSSQLNTQRHLLQEYTINAPSQWSNRYLSERRAHFIWLSAELGPSGWGWGGCML